MRLRTTYSEEELKVMQQRVRGAHRVEATTGIRSGEEHRAVPDLAKRPGHRQLDKIPPAPQYRSKWEAAFANKLELEKRAGLIKAWWHEPFSLWLPGKIRYKPDFMVEYTGLDTKYAQHTIEIIEVKGFSKNRRDGITRLKVAAALFPCFVWRMVWMKKGGGFDGQYV